MSDFLENNGGFLGGLLNFGANLYNINAQQTANRENLAFAREQFNYQQQLNDLVMQREDNAVQRRVADLENAGFNKRLAMSQSAGSQSLSAGNYNANQQAAMMDPLSILAGVTGSIDSVNRTRMNDMQLQVMEIQKDMQLMDLVKTARESDLLSEEIKNAIEKRITDSVYRNVMRADIKQKNQDIALKSQQTEKEKIDNEWSRSHGNQPLSVYNTPFHVSGNFDAGNAIFRTAGGLSASVPSGQYRDIGNSIHELWDSLMNTFGDSDIMGKIIELFKEEFGGLPVWR